MSNNLEWFQDKVNDSFINDLVYLLKIDPDKANDHFDNCMRISYMKYRHYPNYLAKREGYDLVCRTKIMGFFNGLLWEY